MGKPTVAIVGRPNVGKSTFFNYIVGERKSIVEDTPGVTRDRIYSEASYKDYKYSVIDTGGIDASSEQFNDVIKVQASIAIDEADVVLFIVDGKEGLTTNDFIVRDMLRSSGKNVVVVINKIDNKKTQDNIYDFYELAFDTYVQVSGEHGIGFFELQDEIAGYYISKTSQVPIAKHKVIDIFSELMARNVEIRVVDNLWDIADRIKSSTLNWSLCRMKNAKPKSEY